MNERVPVGGRFRWRLTLSFVVVAGIAAGIVAGGSYYLVRRDRYASFIERSVSTATLVASFAELGATTDAARDLVDRLDKQGRFEVIAVMPEGAAASDDRLDPERLPALEKEWEEGARYGETEVEGQHFVVVSPSESATAQLYFYFSAENIEAELARLRTALVQSSLMVLLIAGLAGYIMARQTLRPVARASTAAQALAEGLLETRLPVERQDEFGTWAVSFNEMADALQDKIEALTEARERERRFTSNVAHELRTPLTALVTSASMLRSELASMAPEARWAAERLISQVTRLRDLVEEILEISRLESGQQSLSYATVDARRFLEALVRNHRWEHDVQIDARSEAFASDPRRLERVVTNLISNALHHGGGSASVTVRSDDGSVRIQVKDSGPGIAPVHLERIFDRFYKLDPARSGGSGLGLAIARENARLLGGNIEVESEVGGGSTFTVTIPRAPDVTVV
ncbi:MAG: HAMP domain-containing histidine kinase [Actinobacteria bacterium]|nr:HAMP domain-containing histidine kinase [Actinomycetota bacterium]